MYFQKVNNIIILVAALIVFLAVCKVVCIDSETLVDEYCRASRHPILGLEGKFIS